VFSLLLQVFDDGRLTDSFGHVVDFRHTVIILTSNAGTRRVKSSSLGFQASADEIDYDTMKGRVLQEVKKVFNPEFLNRLDEQIVFRPLTRDDIMGIASIMMSRLNARLQEKGVTLTIGDDVKDYLASEGYDPEYGARPLRRVITRSIEDQLALKLIANELPDECEVAASMENGEIAFKVTEKKPAEAPEEAVGAGATG